MQGLASQALGFEGSTLGQFCCQHLKFFIVVEQEMLYFHLMLARILCDCIGHPSCG